MQPFPLKPPALGQPHRMIRIEHLGCDGHWHWTCPDCGATGRSDSKHQARVNLYGHWNRTHRTSGVRS